ncbi:hypothetical protein ACFL6S_08390 [Candidatus Poribacteria bacterium]
MTPEEASAKKAEEHIQICKRIKSATEKRFADLDPSVYFSTHHHGRYGKLYHKCEEKSREDFWGIAIHSDNEPNRDSIVKRPDVIITEDQRCLYVIEVKWGWISDLHGNYQSSDLRFGNGELEKIAKTVSEGKICRVGKHAVLGKPIPMPEPDDPDFRITSKTEFLLISDFNELMKGCPEYDRIMDSLAFLPPELIYLDYQRMHDSLSHGVIPSFGDYI